MNFKETELAGAYIIERDPKKDDRGSFSRVFCAREFSNYGLKNKIAQSNLSISARKHTLRGMHYQVNGAEEAKLVTCIRGKILDVIVDLRKDSNTFKKHIKIELTDYNNLMLYIPEGFAHGFISLSEDCHVFYHVSNFYAPQQERGFRWNDPSIGIEWPTNKPILSPKDANWAYFSEDMAVSL